MKAGLGQKYTKTTTKYPGGESIDVVRRKEYKG